MRALDIIAKKRDGLVLTHDEINFFVKGFTNGEIPDYQVSAWAMAVLLRGMNEDETTALTLAMAQSGQVLDLSNIAPRVLDKHSSGGVGDKTTLVVAPLIASLGLPVGKMSGRGLGFSGGTLDKLEAIPGYRCDLNTEEFVSQLKNYGIVVSGQTHDLAPADGKLYALRDVTATVPALPLIASSIMSKKIASGAQIIVLDVKVGRGAFMKTIEEATALAELMVKIGRLAGRRARAYASGASQPIGTRVYDENAPQVDEATAALDEITDKMRFIAGRRVAAVISDMNQPLGFAIGNSLEVIESIEALKGHGPHDFIEHCLVVAEQMLLLADAAKDEPDARAQLQAALDDGRALKKFAQWIQVQGGDIRVVNDYSLLPHARIVEDVVAPQEGYIAGIDAEEFGLTSVMLGGGREKKGEPIDYAVGIVLKNKVGDHIKQGQPLFTIHANDRKKCDAAKARLLKAFTFSETESVPLVLIHKVIR
jgi:pyrimidine-nucleoside phosphorylase